VTGWSTQLPTIGGWYWLRSVSPEGKRSTGTVVHVGVRGPSLVVSHAGTLGCQFVEDFAHHHEWRGPLQEEP
jgi:hypothetical protein